METRVYREGNEVFYVVVTPNGYFLVTQGGPIGSDQMSIVGYFGPRYYGDGTDLYGWVTTADCPTDDHNRVGALAWSWVSDPPTLAGQLAALCQYYLNQPVEFREGGRGDVLTNRQSVRDEMDAFFNSLSEMGGDHE